MASVHPVFTIIGEQPFRPCAEHSNVLPMNLRAGDELTKVLMLECSYCFTLTCGGFLASLGSKPSDGGPEKLRGL